MQSRQENTT